MPSTHQSAASGERERFPEVAEVIGEDPARWLDRDLFDHGVSQHRWIEGDPYPQFVPRPDEDVSAPGQMIRDRIRGIDELAVIARWLEVEHELERGPRDRVVELLEARAAELKEIGERPGRLDRRDEPRELPPVVESYPDRPDVDEAADRATYTGPRTFGPLGERYPDHFENETDQASGESAADGESTTG